MGRLEPKHWTSAESLRASAAAWDDLWQRSQVTLPTARAELVASWLDYFAPHASFHALGVQSDGQLVAALPLVGRRIRRILSVADLTWNCWAPNGELLLDPSADVEAVLDSLVDQLRRVRWPLLWFDLVPVDFPWWKALIECLKRRHLAVDQTDHYRIGQVEVQGDWNAYLDSRSQQQLRTLRKDLRRLQRSGRVSLRVLSQLAPHEVEAPLREAFQLELRSWRKQSGSSVLDTPGLFEFYGRLARQLATWGELRLCFLDYQGRAIAFEVGWTAKGVYHSFKVGYEEQHRQYSPGHLLRMLLLERLFQDRETRLVDFQGPITEAIDFWSTREYPIARLVAARNGLGSRAVLAGYRASARLLRSFRAAQKDQS